jgi:phosphate starvation-inducible PhoH-like protein
MRGRTLHDAFVLLDEAQNTTQEQIKMFLTRMGPNSKVIITGDQTQVDLPVRQKSGLSEALKILQNVKGIGIVSLSGKDVIRHKLVKAIIEAYEKDQIEKDKQRNESARN